jgi:RNA polymerase sigma-70 factor (ECF subfamily)
MEMTLLYDLLDPTRNLKKRLGEERGRLFRMAYAWCCESALADDLVQETMTKALQNIHQLRDPERLQSWLYAILHNCWRSYLRQLRPQGSLDEEVLCCEDCPERENDRQQIISTVRNAIAKLPLGQREVVTLVDLNGFTYAEVAEILEMPIGTVMSRLSRARRSLQSTLASVYEESVPATSRIRRIK